MVDNEYTHQVVLYMMLCCVLSPGVCFNTLPTLKKGNIRYHITRLFSRIFEDCLIVFLIILFLESGEGGGGQSTLLI